jgi:hypothetical protein
MRCTNGLHDKPWGIHSRLLSSTMLHEPDPWLSFVDSNSHTKLIQPGFVLSSHILEQGASSKQFTDSLPMIHHHEETTPDSPSPLFLTNQIVDHPLQILVIIPNPFKLVLCHLVTYLSRDFHQRSALMPRKFIPDSFPPACLTNQIVDHPSQTLVDIPKPFNWLVELPFSWEKQTWLSPWDVYREGMQVRGFAGWQICAHEAPLKMTSAMAVFHKNCTKRKGNLAFLTPHHSSYLFHTTVNWSGTAAFFRGTNQAPFRIECQISFVKCQDTKKEMCS